MSIRDAFRFASPNAVRLQEIDTELPERQAELIALRVQLAEVIVECAVANDFSPAGELGQQVRAAEQRIADLEAEKLAAQSAEEKRIEAARIKEAAQTIRAIRARLGELTTARKELDGAVEDIANWCRRADDTFGALSALMPDISWPPGSGSAVAEAVIEAVEIATTGENPPSIEQSLKSLYEFVQTQIAKE